MSLIGGLLKEFGDHRAVLDLLDAAGDAVVLLENGVVAGASTRCPLPLRDFLCEGSLFLNLFHGASSAQVKQALERAQAGRTSTVYAPFTFESELHLEWQFRPVRLAQRPLVFAVGRDISHHRTIQERLLQQATHDALTGLPNRLLLEDRLREAIEVAQRSGVGFAVAALDLDGFKKINDGLGHAAGDALLQKTAARLKQTLRQQDTLARLGGDEFVAIFPGVDKPAAAMHVGQRLLDALREPFTLLDYTMHVATSVGLALYPAHATLDHRLLAAADEALYQAKDAGKGVVKLYAPEPGPALAKIPALEAELFRAVQKKELSLVYQPIVDAQGNWLGLETLMRWHHPELGTISPAEFIPLAESCGLIQLVGAWALQQSCLDVAWLRAHTGQELYVAVNVSPKQLRSHGFMPLVIDALEVSGLPPSALSIEITENTLIVDPDEAGKLLNELMAMGVRVMVDDFGTGYSSLAYLKRFSIDCLKVDRSFVAQLDRPGPDREVCMAILAVARELNLHTVAEGVESVAQFDTLKEAGCERFQGWLFAKPMALPQLAQALQPK